MYATNYHANFNLQKRLGGCESDTSGLLFKIYVQVTFSSCDCFTLTGVLCLHPEAWLAFCLEQAPRFYIVWISTSFSPEGRQSFPLFYAQWHHPRGVQEDI